MKVGDLVTKVIPGTDLPSSCDRIGIVFDVRQPKRKNRTPIKCSVLWSDGKIHKHFRRTRLKVINESR